MCLREVEWLHVGRRLGGVLFILWYSAWDYGSLQYGQHEGRWRAHQPKCWINSSSTFPYYAACTAFERQCYFTVTTAVVMLYSAVYTHPTNGGIGLDTGLCLPCCLWLVCQPLGHTIWLLCVSSLLKWFYPPTSSMPGKQHNSPTTVMGKPQW